MDIAEKQIFIRILVRIPRIYFTVIEDVYPSDTIKYIKTKIAGKVGIPTRQQILIFSGIKLEDSMKLADYNFKNESIIDLTVKLLGGLQIFIKTLSGKTITVNIEATDTIRRIKEIIQTKEGIPFELQRIVFAGRYLENERTLDYYNFHKDSTLHLIILVRGGF
jgi:ubiquitin C